MPPSPRTVSVAHLRAFPDVLRYMSCLCVCAGMDEPIVHKPPFARHTPYVNRHMHSTTHTHICEFSALDVICFNSLRSKCLRLLKRNFYHHDKHWIQQSICEYMYVICVETNTQNLALLNIVVAYKMPRKHITSMHRRGWQETVLTLMEYTIGITRGFLAADDTT